MLMASAQHTNRRSKNIPLSSRLSFSSIPVLHRRHLLAFHHEILPSRICIDGKVKEQSWINTIRKSLLVNAGRRIYLFVSKLTFLPIALAYTYIVMGVGRNSAMSQFRHASILPNVLDIEVQVDLVKQGRLHYFLLRHCQLLLEMFFLPIPCRSPRSNS